MTNAEQTLINVNRYVLALTGYVKDEKIINKLYGVSGEIMDHLNKNKVNKWGDTVNVSKDELSNRVKEAYFEMVHYSGFPEKDVINIIKGQLMMDGVGIETIKELVKDLGKWGEKCIRLRVVDVQG